MGKKEIDFGRWKRNYIRSIETFDASQQLLRKYIDNKTWGDFVLGPTSILLIRQAIELWLQDIFGINTATDEKGSLIKLRPERLFDLINENVKLPVSKSVIKKIHQWTQSYVHAGLLVYLWEIEHAQYVLNPIFNLQNIEITQQHYNDVENQLRKILKQPKLKLYRLKRPESKLIK